MPEKPTNAAGYDGRFVARVRETCLYVATKLGDLMDELVVVGGLVPSLLIEQQPDVEAHVGTMDLDVGLAVAILEEERYRSLTERLRRAGFAQDVNDEGNPTRQRWKIEGADKVTVDFLIQPTRPNDQGGKIRNIKADFAAVIAPGLHLAFKDRHKITLSGRTIMGEDATRNIWVCGAGAFVVLKALAFELRGENKDAYDLFYVVRNYGTGPAELAEHLRPLLPDPNATRAVDILRRDFLNPAAVGPQRVATFLAGQADAAIQADVVGFIAELLRILESR